MFIAGIGEFRYKVLKSNLSGQWIGEIFGLANYARLTKLPLLFPFVGKHRWESMLISWSNIVVEFILQLAAVLWMENIDRSNLSFILCRSVFMSQSFPHGSRFYPRMFVTLVGVGPVWFERVAVFLQSLQVMLLISNRARSGSCSTKANTGYLDWLRLVIAFSVIFGWLRENYLSDMIISQERQPSWRSWTRGFVDFMPQLKFPLFLFTTSMMLGIEILFCHSRSFQCLHPERRMQTLPCRSQW
jgi:hypothetical protein